MQYLYWRTDIWKRHLHNGDHFVSASMCLVYYSIHTLTEYNAYQLWLHSTVYSTTTMTRDWQQSVKLQKYVHYSYTVKLWLRITCSYFASDDLAASDIKAWKLVRYSQVCKCSSPAVKAWAPTSNTIKLWSNHENTTSITSQVRYKLGCWCFGATNEPRHQQSFRICLKTSLYLSHSMWIASLAADRWTLELSTRAEAPAVISQLSKDKPLLITSHIIGYKFGSW